MRHPLPAVLAALLLPAACLRTEYHPYDGRLKGETHVNARSIARIELALAGRDTVTFAVISDTQRHYDETDELTDSINHRPDIDFTLHLGDLTDFGMTKEFTLMRDRLLRLSQPVVCIIGNHDCLGTGGKIYSKMFGPTDFAFTAGPVRIVCLNTNSREYGDDADVPDFRFIASEAATEDTTLSTIVAMHAPPGSEQFDANVATLFESEIHKLPGLLFCLNGHTHHFGADDRYGDGLIYYTCPSAERRTFLVFHAWRGGYSYEVVSL